MPTSDAPDRSVELRHIAIALWSVAMTATLLRVYVRVGIMKSFALDDWLMLGAMASLTSFSTTAILGTYYGSGRHWNVLDPKDAQTAMMYWWACYPSFAITMVFAKFSVGFLMLRIATQKIHRWIIYGALCVTMISGICFFCVAVFQCHPVQYAWTKVTEPDSGTCLSMDLIISMTILYSVFAIITDFTFTLLPAWLVWNLQMDKRTKLALIPILGMACVASSAVAVRFAYVHDFANPDFLWATTDIAIWSETEQALAITAGCFGTLRPLFKLVLTKLGLSQSNTTANPDYHHGSDSRNLKGGSAYARSQGNKFGGSSSKQSSKVGGNGMFGMSTFTRLDDSSEREVGKSGWGEVAVERKIIVTTSAARVSGSDDDAVVDRVPVHRVSDERHGKDGEYRVEIRAGSRPM